MRRHRGRRLIHQSQRRRTLSLWRRPPASPGLGRSRTPLRRAGPATRSLRLSMSRRRHLDHHPPRRTPPPRTDHLTKQRPTCLDPRRRPARLPRATLVSRKCHSGTSTRPHQRRPPAVSSPTPTSPAAPPVTPRIAWASSPPRSPSSSPTRAHERTRCEERSDCGGSTVTGEHATPARPITADISTNLIAIAGRVEARPRRATSFRVSCSRARDGPTTRPCWTLPIARWGLIAPRRMTVSCCLPKRSTVAAIRTPPASKTSSTTFKAGKARSTAR